MTRWARAGSTQKHKKMPEDPTPWEEFGRQQKSLTKTEKKFLTNKVKKIGKEAASTSLKKKLGLKKPKLRQEDDNSPLVENDLSEVGLMSESQIKSELDFQDGGFKEDQDSEVCSKKNKRRKAEFLAKVVSKSKKLKIGKGKSNKINTEIPVPSDNENFSSNQTNWPVIGLFKSEKHQIEKKKLLENCEDESSSSDAGLLSAEEKETVADSGCNSASKGAESTESSPCNAENRSTEPSLHGGKNRLNPKERKHFFERLKEKRAQNGILLLPKQVENRLYRMKKALRAKGVSGEQIKESIRKARRKAELEYRKTLKTCFNCRETGHVLANCPKVVEDNEQGTGICFKCGSTEHTSFRCHIKTSEFPFAKCFICHNVGHLSRNCPENKCGIYPKGGKCNLCGSVNHLRKDCPKTPKKVNVEDAEITAHTINELRSVDDEIVEMEQKTVKQKGPKFVKF